MMPNLQTVLIDNIITKLKIQEKPPAGAGGCMIHFCSQTSPVHTHNCLHAGLTQSYRMTRPAVNCNPYTGYALFLESPSVGSTPVFCA